MQSLLVKNLENSYFCGDVIHAYRGTETHGRYESKTVFVNSGLSADDWPRQFVIVNVVDAIEGEYNYLLENNSEGIRKFYITPQGKDSPFYDELLLNAEISVTKEIFNPLIIERT